MRAATFYAMLLYGVAACSNRIQNQTSIQIKDSLVITKKIFYDTVPVPKDSIVYTFTAIPKDGVIKKSGRAKVIVKNTNGVTFIECKCDSALIINKHILSDSVHHSERVIDKRGIEFVPVTSGFDRFCRVWFFITASLFVGGVAIKLSKAF